MFNKNLVYLALGTVVLVIITLAFSMDMALVSDQLSLMSMVVNAILAVVVVTFFQNREGNSRALKDYFISEISDLKNDYANFIDDIKSDTLNSNTIKKRFKDFSIKNDQLEFFLKQEMKLDVYIQKKNREIHTLITDSYEFNNIYVNDKFSLSNQDNNKVITLHKELNHHFMSLIIQINKT